MYKKELIAMDKLEAEREGERRATLSGSSAPSWAPVPHPP